MIVLALRHMLALYTNTHYYLLVAPTASLLLLTSPNHHFTRVNLLFGYSRLDPTPRLSYPPCDAAVPDHQRAHTPSSKLQLCSQSTAPDQPSSRNQRIDGPRFINTVHATCPVAMSVSAQPRLEIPHHQSDALITLFLSDFSATLSPSLSLCGNLGFLYRFTPL